VGSPPGGPLRGRPRRPPTPAGRPPPRGRGAAGAALDDLGLPPDLARGFALLARTAGLVGHLAEEAEQPLGMALYRELDQRMRYEP
jgi:citrate synthase